MLELFRFAWNALRGHHLRTALSVLGVVIGTTSVVLLTALGEGARIYVTGELASLGSDLLVILPGKVETSGATPFVGGVPHDLTLEDAEALRRSIPSIKKLAPLTLGEATVSRGSLSRDATIIGTTHEFAELRNLSVSRGTFLVPAEISRGSSTCVIGTTIQRELFRGGNPLGQMVRVGDWRFRVIGILDPKGETMGMNVDEMVLIPVATAMKVFNQTTLFRLMVQVSSFRELDSVKQRVTAVIKDRHENEEDITVITQDSVLSSFNQIFTALTLALAGIAAISLTVSGVGIMNVMLVSVSERTPEIGLLKAVGVKRSQIVLLFLTEAGLLSLIGGMIGLVVAMLLVQLSLYLFPALPVQVPQWIIAAALGVALGVGILFGVWPARRASKLDPIIALGRR